MIKPIHISVLLLAVMAMPAAITVRAAEPTAVAVVPETAPTIDVNAANLEDQINLLKGNVEARKANLLKASIDLTDAEAKTFWPIQREYDAELARLTKVRIALVKEFAANYKKLTAESANDLANRAFKLDDDRNALRKKYFDRFLKEVGPIPAVQFIQLERQFETIVDMKIQTQIPLALRK